MNSATLALFVLWLAYGVLRWRSVMTWRDHPPAIPATRRPLAALGWLFGSAAFLLVGLFTTYELGGFPDGGIETWAWLASLGVGLVFVHGQIMAAALIFSMGVEA